MEYQAFLIKYAEIGTKGKNRYVFEDASVTKAVRRQQPLIKAAPASAAARCIDALAEAIITGEEMKVKRGWKGFLQQIFNFSA